ncbi:glycosyltransferase family 2 protein [Desulfocapsa sp. AH-315-G09]|uniref:Glycosyltransferase family 2 protein n=1 Tax=Desulfotalea psychrophila TaxID=84980 RepID=A0ABS3ATG7_9BACT|nr:glycosyltransferase family 2 protein [Desulfocapsa sp.]MBN4065553.1 glycosyltransferase family 2 protein [Desulfocapsa sp. AH-315-G09]MBN4068399.1 glycosyltransferase family 2 protein [Desulfotalea psychrophila]
MITPKPLVSIVTPAYNAESFLVECIESVLAQTYRNWEYLIVNNCSEDSTLDIIKEYAKKDKRIRLFNNKKLLTALQNHNYIIHQISSESKYCKVLHADDWIFSEYLEKMVYLAENNDAVGIVSSYRLVGTKVEATGLPYSQSVFPGKEIARDNLLDGPYTFGTPSTLLIRSDIVREKENCYNENHSGADTELCLEILQNNDFGFIHQVLSFTRVHDDSIGSLSQKFNTTKPNFLYSFTKFGPVYLNTGEYEERLSILLKGYYKFLGEQCFYFKGVKFWNYHKESFRNLGFSFSLLRVIKEGVFFVLKTMMNPEKVAISLLRILPRKRK